MLCVMAYSDKMLTDGLAFWLGSFLMSVVERGTMTMANETFDSPRLQQLVEELEAGKEDALDCFWRDVKAAGIPLVEPYQKKNADGSTDEDNDYSWVSFLYEGTNETKRVSLRAPFTYKRGLSPESENFLIKHIENTNVW